MVAFINWLKPASEDQWRKYLPEIGSFIGDNDADYLRCITSVIGVDLGEVCIAATFAMPARSELWSQEQQFWFHRREAYGKNSMNARWLEQRKDRAKIFEVERILTQEGVKQSGLPNQSLAYIRALQTEATSAQHRSFYNANTVKRKSCGVSRSIRSTLDSLSNLILASVPPATSNAEQKLLVGIGMDDFSQGTRKGHQASMDTKLLDALSRRTKEAAHSPVRVDGYLTSQPCPECLQRGELAKTEYLTRGEDEQEGLRILRIKHCLLMPKVFPSPPIALHIF